MVFQAKKIINPNSEADEAARQTKKDIIYSLEIYNKRQSIGKLSRGSLYRTIH